MTGPGRWRLLDAESLPSDAKARAATVAERRRALISTPPPAAPPSHRASALRYRCDPGLTIAINTALATGLPLLVTGKPGTGKSQVAWFIAAAFGLGEPISLHVRSTTTHRDFLYEFDAVAYLHGAYMAQRRDIDLHRSAFIHPGPYWQALSAGSPRVLLIDEIDKAPRDFPNDLLHVLGEGWFQVPELGRARAGETILPGLPEVAPDDNGFWRVAAREGARPIVVITSNSERRLPEPFLRRCVFHYIDFTPEHIERVVEAHRSEQDPLLAPGVEAEATRIFQSLAHRTDLRKSPTLAECLVWLAMLATRGVTLDDLSVSRLSELPNIELLIKDRQDLESLGATAHR